MGLDIDSRREYEQGEFVYLLDDEEKTAWIAQGHIGQCQRYRLPDHVMVDGERYTIESVEAGAYDSTDTLLHLIIPDSIHYVDEWAFSCENLQTVDIGKGLEYIDMWTFCHYRKLRSIQIDKDNPYLKYENEMVLSKDGKIMFNAHDNDCSHITIPEGVEEINQYAFSGLCKLESITLPSTLRRTKDNSFGNCPKLREVVLPEGFEKLGVQSFMENENLNHIDLPSTLTDIGCQSFMDCPNLWTIVVRSPKEAEQHECFEGAPTDICNLFVPDNLVEEYKQDLVWGVFKHILPLSKKYITRGTTEAEHKELMRIMREIAKNKIDD